MKNDEQIFFSQGGDEDDDDHEVGFDFCQGTETQQSFGVDATLSPNNFNKDDSLVAQPKKV